MIDDLIALGIGADVGLQERANQQMRERGEEPTFWQRHPMLPYIIGFIVGPFVFIGLGAALIGWMVLVTSIDTHNGNTGIIDIVGLTAPFWLPRLIVRRLRNRRQRSSNAVAVRRGP